MYINKASLTTPARQSTGMTNWDMNDRLGHERQIETSMTNWDMNGKLGHDYHHNNHRADLLRSSWCDSLVPWATNSKYAFCIRRAV